MVWNINGLDSKLEDNEFVKFCKEFDVFVLSETWSRTVKNEKCDKIFSEYTAFTQAGV